MACLTHREWIPPHCDAYILALAEFAHHSGSAALQEEISLLLEENESFYENDAINLNPASNVLNPKAEAVLARGLGSRPSLGYPGQKFEMGLEKIEKLEIITSELAAKTFGAKYVEYRAPTCAFANLCTYMALAKPGDIMISPPVSIGGHVTHHAHGAAGLYKLRVLPAPIDAKRYSVDLDALRDLARRVRPKIITVGGSLNLFAHPVREMRNIADETGSYLIFDAAHLAGLIAGGAYPNPLSEGAHLVTMSTYKSLGGPAGALILSNDPHIARSIEETVFPGLTANFDVAKTVSLAITLLDWQEYGRAYASEMVAAAKALSHSLLEFGVPAFAYNDVATDTHQFAIKAARDDGNAMVMQLSQANILTSAIGLPAVNSAEAAQGVRLGTPEIVRRGMESKHMPALARLISDVYFGRRPTEDVRIDVRNLRRKHRGIHYVLK